MGRTNIVLDDALIDECRRETGIGTIRGLVDHALRELLRHERQKKALELKGAIHWEGDIETWRTGRDRT